MKKLLLCLVMPLIHFFTCPLVYAQTTIEFAGQTWFVRTGSGGPGPNNWSNSPESVWVDKNGKLHLKIRKQNDIWYCSEIYAQQSTGYGEYKLYLISDVEKHDPNIVTGFFTYETDTREIDIEFSRWGNNTNVNGWYTIQPVVEGNQCAFALNLSGRPSTHKFNWQAENIHFESYYSHSPDLPSDDSLIKSWTYTGQNIPPAGNERLHINFWLLGGKAPTNNNEAELIIQSVGVPKTESVGFNETSNLTISPNPATDFISIAVPDKDVNAEVTLFNMAGKQQYKKHFSSHIVVDISLYQSGIYFLLIKTEKQLYVKKIIKV